MLKNVHRTVSLQQSILKKMKNSSDWYLNTFNICKVREMSLYWYCQTIKEQENKENKSVTNINEIFACHRHLVYENEIWNQQFQQIHDIKNAS